MLIYFRGVWYDRDKYPINNCRLYVSQINIFLHKLNEILIQKSKNINFVRFKSWHSPAYENQL